MNGIIRYILLTASRDMLSLSLIAVLGITYGLGVFIGGASLSEEKQTAYVIFAGLTRLTLALGMIVFVCFHVRRAFENREIEAFLSKKISRASFMFGYWVGFALLPVIPVCFAGIAIAASGGDIAGTALWAASLLAEQWIIIGFATAAAFILSSTAAATLACAVFYMISRLFGFFVAVIRDRMEQGYGFSKNIEGYSEQALHGISMLLPRLDLYAKTHWLVYGLDNQHEALYFFIIQSFIYVPLLLCMALYDFRRRQF